MNFSFSFFVFHNKYRSLKSSPKPMKILLWAISICATHDAIVLKDPKFDHSFLFSKRKRERTQGTKLNIINWGLRPRPGAGPN